MKQGPSHSMDAKVKTDHLNLSNNSNDILLSVDLTTGNPWSGTFVVPQSGWWRFTFNPTVSLSTSGNRDVYITLKVDGVAAATSTILPTDSGTSGFFPMAINTIQQVDAGQSVTIEWVGDGYIFSSDSKYAHFTGEFLGYLPTHK